MGYLINSGTGFLSNAVTTVSNVKSYLVNKTGYLVDAIRIGIGDFGQRVLDDGGTLEASAEAAASYREITKDIYDQASLVLFPSGYKDNLLYSHKPTNGSGDFTYSRGTDTATRIGADGYIKKERANLLLQSNQFDTTWTGNPSNRSITSGFSGYDGTNNAWKLEAISDNNYSVVNQLVSSTGVETFSVYAKAGTSNFFRIQITGGTNTSASYFDLSGSGAVGNNFNEIDAKIEPVGNGWFRCSVTGNKTTSSTCVIYVVDADGSTNVTTGANVYIQDAQLEEGLVATPYIETTTAPVYEGLTDNLPRIDYTGGKPSVLLEPSIQNRLPNSEYFGDWINTSASFAYNVSNSPQGVKNAIRIIPTSSNFQIKAPVNTTIGSSTDPKDNTFSVFLKHETGGFEYAVLGSGAPQQRYVFNIAEGTKVGSIGSTSVPDEKASIENYGNGWYRCAVTTNNTAGNKHSIYLSDDGTGITATGADGTKGMLAWGAQAERENSYATSYIPTYGSSATRAADGSLGNTNFSDIFGSSSLTQYSIFLDIKDGDDTDSTQVFISKGTNTQGRINLLGGDSICYYSVATGYTTGNNYTDGSPHKYLLVADNGTIKQYFDGSLISTDTNTSDEFTAFGIGGLRSMRISKYIIFPTALSDDDCEALTAL